MMILQYLGVLVIGSIGAFDSAVVAATPLMPPPSAPSNEKDAVRLVALPRTKGADPVDMWVAPTKSKLPSAVLVLCPDKAQDSKALLLNRAWQNFADDHSLGLALVTVSAGPVLTAKNAQPPSPMTQPALVVQAVNREFGMDIPLVIYSWPQQATLAEGLLKSSPKRVLGWCFRAPDYIPDAGNATPPGIVVCYKENKAAYDALMKDFTRGRKAAERLTWIALPGEKPSTSDLPNLDIFVRSYIAGVLSAKVGMEHWQNIGTKQSISEMDLNAHPDLASYLPSPALASAWAALHVPGGPAVAQQTIIEREVDTFNHAQPKLHLFLRRPVNADTSNSNVEGVLAYCTWEGDRTTILKRLQDQRYYLVRYADEHHLALLTWDTANVFSNAESADERSQQQNFTDNLAFEKMADAWERGVHALCYETGLPENNFLLYGLSRGAQWAHRLALRKPGHFLAVHIHVNSSYDWPTPDAKNILWLQTTGEREYGYQSALRFYAKCREMGYPIIFKAGENLGHASSPQIEQLGTRFFDYALQIKARRDKYLAQARLSSIRKSAPLDLYTLSGLDQPPYYADFINQEVYAAEQKEMIPEGQRVALPTKALAQAWGEIVNTPAFTLVSNSKVTATAPLIASPSAQNQGKYTGSSATTDQESRGSAPSPSSPLTTGAAPPVDRAPASATNEPQTTPLVKPAFSNWPEEVARLMREQLVTHPNFGRDLQDSIQRAVIVYPLLSQEDSAMNIAFLAEYHRLADSNSTLLADPTWPEQVAHTVSERLGKN